MFLPPTPQTEEGQGRERGGCSPFFLGSLPNFFSIPGRLFNPKGSKIHCLREKDNKRRPLLKATGQTESPRAKGTSAWRQGGPSRGRGLTIPGSGHWYPAAGEEREQSPCETGKFLLPERNALPCLRDQADFAWPSRRARTLAMPKLAGLPRLPETEAQTGDRGTDSLPTAKSCTG